MIFYCQPTMEQGLGQGYKSGQGGMVHPYACTRRRVSTINEKSDADASATTPAPAAAPEQQTAVGSSASAGAAARYSNVSPACG